MATFEKPFCHFREGSPDIHYTKMFPLSLYKIDIVWCVFQWNGTTTFSHLQLRERTDYGMCCWFTPQFNFTEILRQSELDGLTEPDWGHWFMKIDKANYRALNVTGIKHVFTLITGRKNGKGQRLHPLA